MTLYHNTLTFRTLETVSRQEAQIIDFMQANGSISNREAMMDFDMTSASLAGVVFRLRRKGLLIETVDCTHPTTGQTYVRYFLPDAERKTVQQNQVAA